MLVTFDIFELDTDRRQLTAGGADVDIPPKAFDLLAYLVAHRDRMVPKPELMERFWSAETSEAALQKAISTLRKVLSISETGQGAIQTTYGRGFRFDLPVRDGPALPLERLWQTVLSTPVSEVARQWLDRSGAEIKAEGAHLVARFRSNLPPEDSARLALHYALPLQDQGAAITTRDADAAPLLPRKGSILLDATTRDQLGDEIAVTPEGDAFCLVRAAKPRAGVPHRHSDRQARFVGRDGEMAFLRALETRAQKGGQAVILKGPPGIGKSRLLREFIAASDLPCEQLDCLPALQNTPLAPIHDLCRRLFPHPPKALLDDAIDETLFEVCRGARPDTRRLDSLSDPQRLQRQNALFLRLLQHAAQPDGMILAIEDVHWLDASSCALIEALAQGIAQTHLCLVLTTRPRPGAPLADTVLPLSPLALADSHALLRDKALWPGLEAPAAEGLVQRAAGNPFFIEELALAAKAGADPLADLPHTVQSVVTRRIQSLPPEDRHLLYVAAVIGPPAPGHLLADISGLPDATSGLERLIRQDFLRAEPGGYVFRHMLIRDAGYDMLLPSERARLHRLIAARLEADGAAPEQLAHHYEKAGETAKALTYWRDASRLALHRSARPEAITFARNGLALVGPDTAPKLELDLQICLAPALTALKGFGAEDVGQAYARAHALLEPKTPGKIVVRVLVGLWIHTWVRGRLTESLGHAQTILGISDKVPDPALILQAHAGLGQVQFHKGDMTTALQNLTAGLQAIDEADLTVPAQNAATSCAAYQAWTLSLMGRRAEARAALDRSKAFAGEDNPFAQAIHFALGTDMLMTMGDVPQCLSYADRAVALSRKNGFAFWLGTGLVLRGWALGRQGAFGAAFEALDEGIDVFEATDAGVQLANWYGLRAEVLLGADQPDKAWHSAMQALDFAARAEDVWFTPRIHMTASRLAQILGHTAADSHAAKARELAARFGMAEDAILFT